VCFLAASRGPGDWLLASNSDDPYPTLNHLVVESGDPYAYLAVRVVVPESECTVPWAGMLTRGVNDAGLAFTYAFVRGQDTGSYPSQEWTRTMLARA